MCRVKLTSEQAMRYCDYTMQRLIVGILCLALYGVSFASAAEHVLRLDLTTNSAPFVRLFEQEYDTRGSESIRVFVSAEADVGEECILPTNAQIHIQIGTISDAGVAMYALQAFHPTTTTGILAALECKVYANRTKVLIMAYFIPQCKISAFISVRPHICPKSADLK